MRHVGAGHVAFAVSEAAQGGADLDSSGGASGSVLHVYDARTGLTRNAERNVTGAIVFHDHAFAITTDEARQRWPAQPNAESATILVVMSRSASGSTTIGFFAPP